MIALLPRWTVGTLVCVAFLAGCGSDDQDAVRRGDRLAGEGRIEEAIAEYKLALRQRGAEPEILLRLGHAYAGQGEVDASLRYFDQLLEIDSTYTYQVAADLVEAATVARDEGALDNMARALRPVQRLGIGQIPGDLKLALARYYQESGDPGAALPLYLSALETVDGEPPKRVWFETARSFQELGGCGEALGYYEKFLEGRGRDPGDQAAAQWEYGMCLLEVAETERDRGRDRAATGLLDTLIELGVPRGILDRAHFNRGEVRLAEGSVAGAREDYEMVLELNPARTGPLVRMAEDRLREILYAYE